MYSIITQESDCIIIIKDDRFKKRIYFGNRCGMEIGRYFRVCYIQPSINAYYL